MTTDASPPLPHPPFFTIPNINNLRDAALSVRTSSGAKIRPNTLFRSAEVSKLDFAGWKAMHDLGVAHVFDLRSAPEVDKGWAGIVGKDANGTSDVRPDWMQAMEQAGVKRTWTPVFEESDYSPERLADRYSKYMDEAETGFVEAYKDILRNGGPAFGTIFRYLANSLALPPPSVTEGGGQGRNEKMGGALIHCTAGKDRTGIFFALLFSLLDVPPEEIASEYHLTELGLLHIREQVVARLLRAPGFNKYMRAQIKGEMLSVHDVAPSVQGEDAATTTTTADVDFPPEVLEQGRQAALRMIGARKESMLASLDMLDKEFGGARRYLEEVCGVSEGELEAVRRNLVVGV